MSLLTLWLCVVLSIGFGVASDVPLVFEEKTNQLTSSLLKLPNIEPLDPSRVPLVLTSTDHTMLTFPVAGGNISGGNVNLTIGDIKKALNVRIEADILVVRDEALLLAGPRPGERTIDQVSSIYEYLKNGNGSIKGWSYVSDPRGIEYFSYPNETLKIGMKKNFVGIGDCDDFAILMSTFIESVGGTTRIILAHNNSTGGHAYTEVYLGKLSTQNNNVEEILGWLKMKYNTKLIYYHVDPNTNDVWLNLDWGTDKNGSAHPGGPFYQADRHFVVIIRGPIKESLNVPDAYKAHKLSEIWQTKGTTHWTQKEDNEAIEDLDKAIQIDPNNAAALGLKGEILKTKGKHDEALNTYDKCINLYDEESRSCGTCDNCCYSCFQDKVYLLFHLGRYEDALLDLNKFIERYPEDSDAWLKKGETLSKLGRHNEAIKAFDKTIYLENANLEKMAFVFRNGTKARSLLEKGNSLFNLWRYDEAIQAYDNVIEFGPIGVGIDVIAIAWNNKGNALKLLSRTTEAEAAFTKARELGYTG